MYIAGRNPQKIEEAIEDLRQVTGKTAFALQLDLADLKSIKAAVSNFLEYVFRSWPTFCPLTALL